MSGAAPATRKPDAVISATATGRASPPADDQVARDVAPGTKLRHRPQRAAPDDEVVQRARLVVIGGDVPVADLDDAIAGGQRQRGRRQQRQHLEDDRADADRERHRQPADDGEARIPHEHPPAELEVEREPVEPGAAAPVAQLLLEPLDAAEVDQRAPANRPARADAPRAGGRRGRPRRRHGPARPHSRDDGDPAARRAVGAAHLRPAAPPGAVGRQPPVQGVRPRTREHAARARHEPEARGGGRAARGRPGVGAGPRAAPGADDAAERGPLAQPQLRDGPRLARRREAGREGARGERQRRPACGGGGDAGALPRRGGDGAGARAGRARPRQRPARRGARRAGQPHLDGVRRPPRRGGGPSGARPTRQRAR